MPRGSAANSAALPSRIMRSLPAPWVSMNPPMPTRRMRRPTELRSLRSLASIGTHRGREDIGKVGQDSGLHDGVEAAIAHALDVEGHALRVHHLREARVLHHFGVDAVAMGAG